MDRRELLKLVAALTGSAVIGGEFFLSGCNSNDKKATTYFSDRDVSFFDEVAETIIPKTDTPGAKDAAVGNFMASYPLDCYDESQLKTLKDGIDQLNAAAQKKSGKNFVDLSPTDRQQLLTSIDAEAKEHDKEQSEKKPNSPHYFTLMKQLVLLGFFTSKPGVTQVLRYVPVPGKYVGCIDLKEGETSWA